MNISESKAKSEGIRFSVLDEENLEIARATLFFMYNDLHKEPFGLLEDLFVNENHRGKGIATSLITHIIQKAKEQNCYKLIATSRYERERVHSLYKELGFKDYGKEFRINL
ncbi:MAG: GNAT family N-acetyltransferase [Candidatus Gracilibacteria bacterium]|jgi:GNAT superfamily N-acetyltransferase|nr:GNAT family N-acetyltransferase [Candidatus Gracilibacteria bacterium]